MVQMMEGEGGGERGGILNLNYFFIPLILK